MKNKIYYKDWEIEKGDHGYYEAINICDCDKPMKFAEKFIELIDEIDEDEYL